MFSSAIGNARALALERLGSGGGTSQEGDKGLYPCLVQLQCVAEMEEAFEVQSSSGPGGVVPVVEGVAEQGQTSDDAVRYYCFVVNVCNSVFYHSRFLYRSALCVLA